MCSPIHLGMLPELDAQIAGAHGALPGADLAKGEGAGRGRAASSTVGILKQLDNIIVDVEIYYV